MIDAPVIFCDVDNTVAALTEEWILKRYARFLGRKISRSEVTSKWIDEHANMGLFDVLHDVDLYDHVRPILGAKLGVITLRKLGYRVVFATSGPISNAEAKYNWLVKYGFIEEDPYESYHKDFIAVPEDKSLLKGFAIIDDRIRHVIEFDGYGILLDQPWNSVKEFEEVLNELPPSKKKMMFRAIDWNDIIRIASKLISGRLP